MFSSHSLSCVGRQAGFVGMSERQSLSLKDEAWFTNQAKQAQSVRQPVDPGASGAIA